MKHSDLIICIAQILWFSVLVFGHYSHVNPQMRGKERIRTRNGNINNRRLNRSYLQQEMGMEV